MSKLNPCVRDCPRRSAFCRRTCEAWKIAQEEKTKIREAREKELLLLSYLKDSAERKRRRARNGHVKG